MELVKSTFHDDSVYLKNEQWQTVAIICVVKYTYWLDTSRSKNSQMSRCSLYVSTKFSGEHAPGPPSSIAPSMLAGLRHLEPDHFEKSDDGPGN
ncbi:hypothetical protein DPMN_124592 [Dreissena polymorpha]|uniref:Uncharacterized protein n=1 Tax=Dreissena polymorpha TaxID=45954 RepID=A0A9D4JSP1_DREPO|nr:hypothetical protein DPMN_124592 [Dreissena polymorpha]